MEPTRKPLPKPSPKATPIASDAPTALIAPSDYVHIYAATKEPNQPTKTPNYRIEPPINPRKPQTPAKAIPSDSPTALIAPSDYVHIFAAAPKENQPKTFGKRQQETPRKVPAKPQTPVKAIPSDAPTALIAPSDYVHIYAATKETTTKPEVTMKKTMAKVKKVI